jgi:hypothetical protein
MSQQDEEEKVQAVRGHRKQTAKDEFRAFTFFGRNRALNASIDPAGLTRHLNYPACYGLEHPC